MSENKFLIPLSVLVAGALIGGAVFFKSKTSPTPTDPNEPANIVIEPLTADDHVFGNPNAPVTIIEFSDIDCPFCSNFDVTMRRIISEYGPSGEVAWVYRHFPLDQLHPEARLKAESTECVAELAGSDAFWNYLGALFERDGEKAADLSAIAAEFGVDATAFQSCVDAKTYAQDVEDDVQGALAAGGRGTPYSIAIGPNGEKFPINGAQPYDVVKQVIDTLLLAETTE